MNPKCAGAGPVRKSAPLRQRRCRHHQIVTASVQAGGGFQRFGRRLGDRKPAGLPSPRFHSPARPRKSSPVAGEPRSSQMARSARNMASMKRQSLPVSASRACSLRLLPDTAVETHETTVRESNNGSTTPAPPPVEHALKHIATPMTKSRDLAMRDRNARTRAQSDPVRTKSEPSRAKSASSTRSPPERRVRRRSVHR